MGITSRNERCLLPLRPCLSVYAQRFFSFNDTWSIKKTKLFQPYFLFFSLSLFFFLLASYIFSTYDFVSFATTDRSFPFSIICRDGPSAIDFSRGTWLPATEPEGKRGVRSGKRSTTIWHEARRWLPAPLSPLSSLFFFFLLSLPFGPEEATKVFPHGEENFEKTSTGKTKFIPLGKTTDRGVFPSQRFNIERFAR